MVAWLGPAIAAGSQLAGGLLSSKAANDAQNLQQDLFNQQTQLQLEFAKKGIQWKVADAKKAGIHPLYALGANTLSYQPQSLSFGSADGNWIGDMGQNIDRAIQATNTLPERQAEALNRLAIDRASKENELLDIQIANARAAQIAGNNPPMQAVVDTSSDPLPGQGDAGLQSYGYPPATLSQEIEAAPNTVRMGTTSDARFPWVGYSGIPDSEFFENAYGDVGSVPIQIAKSILDPGMWLMDGVGDLATMVRRIGENRQQYWRENPPWGDDLDPYWGDYTNQGE